MTKQSIVWTAVAAAALLGLPAYCEPRRRRRRPSAMRARKMPSALRIMFGEQRIHPKTWDGEIALDRGSVLRLTGVFFEQKDELIGKPLEIHLARHQLYGLALAARLRSRPHQALGADPERHRGHRHGAAGCARFDQDRRRRFLVQAHQLKLGHPLTFLDGEVSVERLPPTVTLTTQPGENDYPSLTVDSRGDLWASWISYADRADSVWVAHRGASGWEPPVARQRRRSQRQLPHRARRGRAEAAVGHLVGQGRQRLEHLRPLFRRRPLVGHAAHHRRCRSESLSRRGARFERQAARGMAGFPQRPVRNSDEDVGRADVVGRDEGQHRDRPTPGCRPRPPIATATSGSAGTATTTATSMSSCGELGRDGKLDERRQITRSPGYDANVSLACDRTGRLWIAWDCRRSELGQGLEQPAFQPARRQRTLSHARPAHRRAWKAAA